jgi:hypothetical protein
MPLGPLELVVVSFPGNRFTGEIIPALTELVDSGTIHIVDLLFVHKDHTGQVEVFEYSDLGPEISDQLTPLLDDTTSMLNEDDAHDLAAALDFNSSAGVLLFENTWATRLATAVRNAKGEVVFNERIPQAAVEALEAGTA